MAKDLTILLVITSEVNSNESSGGMYTKLVKINHLNTEKFDWDNFFTWQAYINTLLWGYCLLPYVETSIILKDDQLLLGSPLSN